MRGGNKGTSTYERRRWGWDKTNRERRRIYPKQNFGIVNFFFLFNSCTHFFLSLSHHISQQQQQRGCCEILLALRLRGPELSGGLLYHTISYLESSSSSSPLHGLWLARGLGVVEGFFLFSFFFFFFPPRSRRF
ncbi:hypothetical protein F4809DRAFT_71171 [Biscogniauxia mediterranea]|nr:hypothetical protein F4809DRAFT_71171 [Biscogniauxia mediterranea]